MQNFEEIIRLCPWGDELHTCAITVCDREGIVLYQNARSQQVNGDVRGRSLIPCHNQRSREIIARLMTDGCDNVYTIEKRGIRKMIFQTPWRTGGEIRGLVEFSLEIPSQMPHYVRE
ncbi:MAG: PAS sensor protein [Alistipes sp.]|nr:PAS sensor protein [Alistipes sp.]